MKVLMLGWEFPPHISGGLGTACFGLTQGLNAEEVEVLFVVPRAHGDEDQTHARIMGCNSAVFPEIRTTDSGSVAAEDATPDDTTDNAASESGEIPRKVLKTTLTMLTVESSLSPYLDEGSYQLHQERKTVAEASKARREAGREGQPETLDELGRTG